MIFRGCTRLSRPIKAALLDQRLVAGIGNIYASESLWRARLNPRRPANPPGVRRIAQAWGRAIVASLRKRSGTGRAFLKCSSSPCMVGKGKPCRRCGTVIRRHHAVATEHVFLSAMSGMKAAGVRVNPDDR